MPAIYVHLDRMPLTPSGKLDRNALPSPGVSVSSASNVYTAPRTKTEHKLVAMWEEILKRSPIGIHDNFFDVGGHSLLAVTLLAKVEREFGRHLPLVSLFQNATIAELARLVEIAPGAQQIPKAERSGVVPLSFSQERFWFLDRLEGPSATY